MNSGFLIHSPKIADHKVLAVGVHRMRESFPPCFYVSQTFGIPESILEV